MSRMEYSLHICCGSLGSPRGKWSEGEQTKEGERSWKHQGTKCIARIRWQYDLGISQYNIVVVKG